MSHATEFDELNLAQPSAKRQKTTHPVSSPRSGLSDPLDQLPPDFIHFGPNHSQSTNGALSIHSQGSGFQIKRTGTSVGSLPEFKNVERMMDSNPKNRKNKRGKDSQTSKHDPKLLPSSPKSTSVNHPIDISGDDEVKEVDSIPAVIPPRRYQGTARNPPLTVSGIQKPNISKAHQSRSTEKRSPYFNSSTPTIDINGKAKQWSIQPASQSLTGEPTERLAQQFVATDGKRRGSDVNMSSDVDELSAVNTTVGNRADPNAIFSAKNPHLDSNSKDSSSTVRVTSPTKEDGGLPPSTVKPSIFVNGEPKSQISTRPSRGRLREEKPPWAIDVAAVRIGSRLCQVTDGLALVYDARSQTYGLRKEGKATSFGIQPDKLLRIIFGNSGRKVRFESAKTQHEESTLDLEFRKEKDVKEVVDKLSNESGCKILSRER